MLERRAYWCEKRKYSGLKSVKGPNQIALGNFGHKVTPDT